MNIKLKYGRDIVPGDIMLVSQGTTVPFLEPIMPAQVIEVEPYGPNRQFRITCKQSVTLIFVVWGGEQYMVLEEQNEPV